MNRHDRQPTPGAAGISRRGSIALMLAAGAAPLISCAGASHAQDAPRFTSEDERRVATALGRALAAMAATAHRGGFAESVNAAGKRFGGVGRWPMEEGEILVRRPGTPHIAASFLRAHMLGVGADPLGPTVRTARALASIQNTRGGWDRRAAVPAVIAGQPGFARRAGTTVFGDQVTTSAARFLGHTARIENAGWLEASAKLAFDGIAALQSPSGGWVLETPTPPSRPYARYDAFNDGTTNGCIEALLLASQLTGEDRYLDAAAKGGRFILATRLSGATKGWAQQYDAGGDPVAARKFEPPAACSAVTGRNIRTLLDLFVATGDESFLAAIDGATAWLAEAILPSKNWSRFYDLRTGRPIYVDKEGAKHTTADRGMPGYLWEHDFGITRVLGRVARLRRQGPEAFRAEERRPWPEDRRLQARARSRGAAMAAIKAQEADGLWRLNGLVVAGRFVSQTGAMLRFLELGVMGGERREELAPP